MIQSRCVGDAWIRDRKQREIERDIAHPGISQIRNDIALCRTGEMEFSRSGQAGSVELHAGIIDLIGRRGRRTGGSTRRGDAMDQYPHVLDRCIIGVQA